MAPLLTRRSFAISTLAAAAAACSRPAGETVAPPAKKADRGTLLVVRARPTIEGAGVRLRRSLGGPDLPLLDPFLLLDEMHSTRPEDSLPGFPDHPHRGFETVTYVIEGAVEHRDSVGNHGMLRAGSAQWMTAGRGIIHSEMPQPTASGIWGFQLWVNLPAADKMMRPRYQDIAPETIPEVDLGDARARIVAGTAGSTRGPVDGIAVAPTMFDLTLPAGGRFRHPLPGHDAAFVYVTAGDARVGEDAVELGEGDLAVLGQGEAAALSSTNGGRLLLLSGTPIGEPVARRGPFVMNTDEEIQQAYADYRSGRLTDG